MSSPGLRIDGGAASAVAEAQLAYLFKQNGFISEPTTAGQNMPSLLTALGRFAAATGNLAVNDARIYTFLVDFDEVTAVFTYSVVCGDDFLASRAPTVDDFNFGNPENYDEKKVIVGYLWVQNGSAAVFIPNTTNLDAAGITSRFINNSGWIGQ